MFGRNNSISNILPKIITGLILYLVLASIYKTYSTQEIARERLEYKALFNLNKLEESNYLSEKKLNYLFKNGHFCGWNIIDGKTKSGKSNSKFFDKYAQNNSIIESEIEIENKKNKIQICLTTGNQRSNIISEIILEFTLAILIIILIKIDKKISQNRRAEDENS